MKIHIIMPVITETMNNTIVEHLRSVANNDTIISISTVSSGPVSIESMFDEEFAAKPILEEAVRQQQNGVDGIIIYCFGNPAIDAAKEILDIPVIGIGEASLTLSVPLSEKFGIVTTVQNSISRNIKKTKQLGLGGKLGKVIPLNLPVIELTNHNQDLIDKITGIVKPHIDNHSVDLVHLGCGFLIGLAGRLSKELGIPVIDPGLASLKLIETYVKLNLIQSPITYMTPPDKKRT